MIGLKYCKLRSLIHFVKSRESTILSYFSAFQKYIFRLIISGHLVQKLYHHPAFTMFTITFIIF